MRITGPGIWGAPPAQNRAKTPLRRAVDLGVTFIYAGSAYGPRVSEQLIAETLDPYPAEQVIATKGGLVRSGPRALGTGRAARAPVPGLRGQPGPAEARPVPARPARPEGTHRRVDQRAGRAQRRGQDPPHRKVQLLRSPAQGGGAGDPVASVQSRYNAVDRSSEAMMDLCEQETLMFLPWARSMTEASRRSSTPPGGTARAPGRWCRPGRPGCRRSWAPAPRSTWRRTWRGGSRTQPGRGHRDHQERLTRRSQDYRDDTEPIDPTAWHETIDQGELPDWRAAQLTGWGSQRPLAEAVADQVNWHEIAALVHRGCGPQLALNIVL
jgi:hypothetical protein